MFLQLVFFGRAGLRPVKGLETSLVVTDCPGFLGPVLSRLADVDDDLMVA